MRTKNTPPRDANKARLPHLSASPLTEKEKRVLQFIEQSILQSGISPSYQEIMGHFGFASYNSVQNYMKQLRDKGYVEMGKGLKRSVRVLIPSESHRDHLLNLVSTKDRSSHASLLQAHAETCSLPFLGRVAAGIPLERVESGEIFSAPSHMVKHPEKSFVLQVEGDSMIDEGIFNGDFLLVESRPTANNGDIVVATVDNESTVKTYYFRPYPHGPETDPMVELRPANPRLRSMWYSPDEVQIRGKLIGLLRKY